MRNAGRRAFGARRGAAFSYLRSPNPPVLVGLLADFDPSTLTPGAVSSFASRVSGYSVVQATGGSQPVASATSLNARPGVTYDGVDDFLDGASALAALLSGAAPYTAYYVATSSIAAGFMTPWSLGKTADNATWVQEYKNSGPNQDSYGRSATSNTTAIGSQVLVATPYDHVGVFSGVDYNSFVNGVASLVASANTRAPVAMDRLTLGGLAFGATTIQPWAGVMGRWLMYNSAHSAAQIARTRAWLRARYGL